eukprot:m.209522 g.209522  ORF g.209522 m.209522 type:complete len:368 (-) comp53942_c0_seq10:1049-2152(-)
MANPTTPTTRIVSCSGPVAPRSGTMLLATRPLSTSLSLSLHRKVMAATSTSSLPALCRGLLRSLLLPKPPTTARPAPTISTQKEFAFTQTLANKTTVWLAGSDSAVEGVWRWMAGPENGQIINPTFWNAGQPDNTNNQDCLWFWDAEAFMWDDAGCASTAIYLVEYEAPPQQYGTHYYQLFTATLDFNTALAAATQTTYNGWTGHLATVTSSGEMVFTQAIVNKASVWLAGSDSATECVWRWAGPESGQIINPTFWDNGQPDNLNNQDCMWFWNTGTFLCDDVACATPAMYLVEYEGCCGAVLVSGSELCYRHALRTVSQTSTARLLSCSLWLLSPSMSETPHSAWRRYRNSPSFFLDRWPLLNSSV